MNCSALLLILQVAPDVVIVSFNKPRVQVKIPHPLVGTTLQHLDRGCSSLMCAFACRIELLKQSARAPGVTRHAHMSHVTHMCHLGPLRMLSMQ